MKLARLLLPLAALAAVACRDEAPLSAPVEALPAAPLALRAGEPIPGQYLVVFRESVADVDGLARQLVAANGGTLRYTYHAALRGFAASLSAQAAEALARNPNVSLVEQDQVMTAVGTQSPATWGLDRIDQRNLPLTNSYTYAEDGTGVTAYIIDTGIRFTHSEFAGGRATSGYDAVDGGSADDCNGHGTHVAGTVGGTTYGVAKKVTLVAVRVLDCGGSGSTSGVVAGIDWVTGNHAAGAAAVANMSLGGGASSTLDAAVRNSIADGVAYAIAAGNGNFLGIAQDACTTSPARVTEAMTIGATDNTDKKASWSNYGNCVDWFAPGVSITSSWYSSDVATNTISGTSMATPHVTGAAALYLQANPGSSPQQVRDGLYAMTTKGIVTSSSTANNHLLYTGDIGGGGSGGNQAPTASFTSSCSDLSCNFTDASTDDGSIASWSWNFGDGATSTAQNPTHGYGAAGTYTVTLTVTDNLGATGTTSKSVTVTAPAGSITLTASGSKTKGSSTVVLSWNGGTAPYAVYRNGAQVGSSNTNSYTDKFKGGGTYTYQVCSAGGSDCSNSVTITL